MALHRGLLSITGRAPDLTFKRSDDAAATQPERSDSASKLTTATIRVQARDALVGLGFRSREASTAVDAALAEAGTSASIEVLLRAALQHCPKPLV